MLAYCPIAYAHDMGQANAMAPASGPWTHHGLGPPAAPPRAPLRPWPGLAPPGPAAPSHGWARGPGTGAMAWAWPMSWA